MVKQNRVLFFGFSCLFALGLGTAGCGNDSTPAQNRDAGKSDTLGATGGSGGKSSATGGSKGTGGSMTGGTGGTSQTGGSTSAGGATGAGGVSGTGGATSMDGSAGVDGGEAAGGSTGGALGTGGVTGAGGALAEDAGTLPDLQPGPDAIDAPLPDPDVPAGADVIEVAADIGTPIQVDTAALDSGNADAPSPDTIFVFLDGAPDESPDLAEGVETGVGLDGSHDAGNCLEQIVANGYAFPGANACSLCRDTTQTPATNLEAQCNAMIDCLAANLCMGINAPGNCWVNCRNTLTGNQISTANCAEALTTAACQ